ncbi:MAG: response regulator [Deltaproteobacteria bacterium]|nr:response regulator [Deltaproteobacteria bacterium]
MIKCKVMVVDDEQGVRSWISHLLRSKGCEVLEAAGFKDALGVLEREDVDVLVTDIMMPDGSGLELCKFVKEKRPDTRVAVMTGHHSEEQAIEGLLCGVDYYLRKPFSNDDILDAVSSLKTLCEKSSSIGIMDTRPGWHEFFITSSEDSLIKLQSFLGAMLKDRLDEERYWDLHLAVNELGRNAIEWGNKNDAGSVVKISVGILDNCVTIKIEDKGEGFDVKRTLEGIGKGSLEEREEERIAQDLRPGGMGIHLIKETADRLVFNEKGNLAILSFRLGG